MIKKIMPIAIVIAFVLSQSIIAHAAFVQDGIYGLDSGDPEYIGDAFVASADLTTGDAVEYMTANIKAVGTGAAATTLDWDGVISGVTEWAVSKNYLEIAYYANQIGWGVQLYTDNMDTNASPQFTGDPTSDPNQQPAGLIGVTNSDLVCPMALLVTDDAVNSGDLDTPVEATSGTPGQPNYVKYFTTGYDEDTGATGVEKVWFWMKDVEGTVWDDANANGNIDTGELVPGFNSPNGYPGADDYATVVNTMGTSSGWVPSGGGLMQRDSDLGAQDGPEAFDPTPGDPGSGDEIKAYTMNVYFAADFTNARELQEYKTNTITLELYHEG